jgi:hypothetical protein
MQLRLLLSLEYERIEINEPNVVQLRTDTFPASFAFRTESEDPSDRKSRTETCDPALATFLSDMLLPQLAKFSTETALPRRPKERILKHEPKCANCMTEIFMHEPIADMPWMLVPDPNLE